MKMGIFQVGDLSEIGFIYQATVDMPFFKPENAHKIPKWYVGVSDISKYNRRGLKNGKDVMTIQIEEEIQLKVKLYWM